MNSIKKSVEKLALLAVTAAFVGFAAPASAAPLALPDLPLFLPESVPPLNMIVLGRDHKLYYEAYNDYTDLNDDDKLDLKYKPVEINYFGYFDSFKCYTYSTLFVPTRYTLNKQCGGAGEWSGDFLNYLTTARIDALRKVLYGGYRSTDGTTTILERTLLPQDAHSWGKEYESEAVDGYNIRNYTPYDAPTSGRHLFANTTLLGTTEPLLRVLLNRSERIWNWVSIERPVADSRMFHGGSGPTISPAPTDMSVRVEVCIAGLLEANCQRYGTHYKPIGLLQEFGENDSMYFGLISGSYFKNTSGGVLRSPMGSIRNEIDMSSGIFNSNTGIITTLNRLRTTGFQSGFVYSCGWNAAARPINPGECQMWGNPIAEMMYESLRYFAGKSSPTADYDTDFGDGDESTLPGNGLPVATWDNPYSSRPVCSKPFNTVISDINPSYDTDQLPGTAFGTFTESNGLSGLNVATRGQKIWDVEMGGPKAIFIGDVGGVTDGAPTVKTATSFGNIRGLSPEEPTKNGGYYAASVAHHGHVVDLNGATGDQKVSTFAVALASPLPRIEITVDGKTITLVPFAKSVNGSGISSTASFQPTDQIVDFYVDTLTPTYGKFRVNFEDVEQGADHDMDAIVVYEYTVVGNTVDVTLTSEYAAGGITQHMGYVISGTTKDGIYLDVRDQLDGDDAPNDVNFSLDTPPTFTGTPPAPSSGPGTWADGVPLPFTATRSFSPGSTNGATVLKDPLWYAAKWGGFDESFREPADRDDIPNSPEEWDEDNDGTPDNYFLVTNALRLSQQLRSAFEDILRRTTSSSSASVNSGSISSDTRVYQARFNTGEWTGQLLSYELNQATGAIVTPFEWEASARLPLPNARAIITTNSDDTPVAFRWADLDATRQAALDANATRSALLVDYLRGSAANEGTTVGKFRERPTKLGDIVSSSPLFVGAPPFRYRDSLEAAPYSTFANANANRQPMVYAGANDGMLHAFNAETGREVFAFIPSPVFGRLRNLADQNYAHQFYVDGPPSLGDVFFNSAWHTVVVGGLNKGGQGIYALDVTSPSALGAAETTPSNVRLWEFTDAQDEDLGLTYSQPAIVKLRSGRWAAVFGNGYNSTAADGRPSATGNAVLYIVDIETGDLIRKLDTNVGVLQDPSGLGRDNGLSTPSLVDLNGDRIVEYAYAGDLYGNLWKFDLSSTDSDDWDVAFRDAGNVGLPLYQARDAGNLAQPITVRPEVGRGPFGSGMIVLFGTGKYLEASDKLLTPQRPQSFYGIVDRNSGDDSDRVPNRAALTQQSIIVEQAYDFDGAGPLAPIRIRATTNNGLGANRGWYIDLVSPVAGYQGEKQVSNPIVRNGNVVFTTLIPDADPCAFGGTSWIMEISLLDGSRLEVAPFDLNNNGEFTDADNVPIVLPDGTRIVIPVSGVGSTEGILQSPGVIEGEMGGQNGQGRPVQYKYLPGSSGSIQRITENPGAGGTGRQSWRQVR